MAKVGTVECLCCGQSIPVKSTTGGGVSVCCPWCDFSGYAKAGTEAARVIASRMKAEAPAETEKPAAAQKPAPAAAKPAAKPVPAAPAKPASLAEVLNI